jgi:sarcosine oxidase, subunit alpha
MNESHDRWNAIPTRLTDAVAAGRIVGRSHRLHRGRGGACARGYCQQCPLADGGLACETRAGEGGPFRSGGIDPLRPLGRIGERMEPWFYERRFLRPRVLRQPMLEVLRRLSAAHALPRDPAVASDAERSIETDVLILGGGPAGLAAAATIAATAGVVVATRSSIGGSLPRDAASTARTAADAADLRRRGATLLEGTTCLGWYEDEGSFAVMAPDGPVTIHATRVVIATGAYDRPLLVPGTDLPGAIGLRAFELLAAQGAFRRRTAGIVGVGPELGRALQTASAFRVGVDWIVAGLSGGVPAQAGVPAAAGLPVHARTIRAIEGRSRVHGVRLDDGRMLRADVVVTATTQPTFELQLQLGATPHLEGRPPVIRTQGVTSIPSLAVGEAAGWVDAAATPDRAAAAASAWLDGTDPETIDPSPHAALAAEPSDDAVVCACEDVRQRDVDRSIADGYDDVELVKRRSGATTGACQGKLCHALLAEAFAAHGLPPALTTVRPPVRPVRVADLGGVTT